MIEQWLKSIIKNVDVSNLGRLRSSTTKEIITATHNFRGSISPYLSYKNRLVHRLVAIAFIPNVHNYPQVNHKDENKTNNAVDNLEWCTQSYNMKHCYNGIHKKEYSEKQRQRALGNKSTTGKHWTHSEESRRKRSLSMKGVYNSNHRAGTHHSEETKRKMSEARKAYYERKRLNKGSL